MTHTIECRVAGGLWFTFARCQSEVEQDALLEVWKKKFERSGTSMELRKAEVERGNG